MKFINAESVKFTNIMDFLMKSVEEVGTYLANHNISEAHVDIFRGRISSLAAA